ncbi:MAG: molybdopterin-dependent oxidoreductase Mo/Fe-S-binding subunit [Spirochaetia bacterium]|jgi:putative selenate reductase molybdopterin-binding subunit
MKISFTLNGAARSVSAEPGENLQVLLQRIGIPSVRSSDDGEGFAGSDTILFDGRAVLAGLMVAGQAEGHSIETIESLGTGSRLSVLQEAMIDAGVVQSAYNTPAAALLLEELIRRKEAPTEDDIRDALSGLFSRATGYKQFFLAVELARKRRKDPTTSEPVAPSFRDGLRVIGKSRRKIDGVKLVAGMKAYVEDRVEQGSCVLRMLRSPHAHASIRSIDTTQAQALPGVVLVIDHRNCPDVAYTQAGQGFPEPSPYDYRMFSRTVRHMGDRVAAVVAEDEATARQALALIRVEYDVIPPVLTLEDAMGGGITPVHADHVKDIVYQLPIGAEAARNLAASASGGTGDVEEGFRAADTVIERTYSTSRVQCTPLEPHVVYTRMDGDRLIVHASTQVPWHLRRILARVLGMQENRIRVIKERVGGGYGSKQDILLEEVCAFATVCTGRPVLYKYTREEEFIAATTRHPFRITVKIGAKRDGTLMAIRMSADADTGAYGQHCLTVPMNACSKSLPLFRCQNMAWEVRSWYTNHVPSGAYQGYGAPQGSFALQMAAAELADALGMDLVSFLDRNHVREGDVLEILKSLGEGRAGAAAHVRSCGLDRALQQGCRSIGWGSAPVGDADPDVKIGKGVAIIQQGSGLPGLDQACADVKLLSDGTFMVHSGGADLGTGLDTVLAKIAAETLCCDLEKVAVISGDTDTTPFDKGAYASSGTYFSGNASLKAAQDLRDRILAVAASMLKEPVAGLSLSFPGTVTGKSGAVEFAGIARYCQGGGGPGELVGHASFTTDDAAFPYAAHFCEVGVNVRTGVVQVHRYHAVTDCGTPINPEMAQGQVYGAILKTIGHALYEEMIFDGQGRCLTTTLADYGAPMIQELPRELDVSFVETDDPFGPFGGKSVSEISMNGAAPAIAAAIHAATGVWMRHWPMTPEKILTALGRIS